MKYEIEGNIVSVQHREIFEGSIMVENGIITDIRKHPINCGGFIIPGFIDSHVHIESSMLTPGSLVNWQFGREQLLLLLILMRWLM